MKVLICSTKESMTNTRGNTNPEFVFFGEENIKKVESMFDEVIWNETGRQFTTEELIEKVKDVDAVITCWGSNQFTKEILDNAPKLKIIAHLAGSVARQVTEDVYDRGIKVIGANDTHFSESVAEGALAYMMMSLRGLDSIVKILDEHKDEGWAIVRQTPERRGVMDRTIGLVSFGAIAEHLARMLQPFHCKIKVYSRAISDEKLKQYNMERASLEEIFSTCDIISIHTAWNKHTENMISKELLQMIKKDALLINTARGKVIDEPAMIEELKTGRFKAVLDVFWEEPHPYVPGGLYDLDNVIVVPHQGGPTTDRYRWIANDILDEIYGYLKDGKPLKSEIPKERAINMTI
ncbi:MAG: hydroxyacid dehydrogenase [Clostridia bacterium]|nr:hydroxyacid dehydrogenase [Oscillospiraceae bacterium]MBR4893498.1 hydroxyacid dehydrogenase [Clostridia bacterium]